METKIESAQITDVDAILKLCFLAYQSEAALYEDWTIAPLLETYFDLRAVLSDSVLLVARRDGEVIGSVRGRNCDDVIEITRLVVHPRFQRQGIGSRLLATIEMEFAATACFKLFTGHRSEGNLRLYERHGYREVRREFVSSALIRVVMRKLLAA